MAEEFKGWTLYEGMFAHQVEHYLPVWSGFLTEVRPARILEIGTSDGGFILSLKDATRAGNPECEVRSYDMFAKSWYPELIARGVDVRVENLFNYNYDELLPEGRDAASRFIQQPGATVVICDGGSKKNEFRLLAPLLKPGDFILAHDYAESRSHFEAVIRGRLWNWCEITEDDICEVSLAEQLVPIWQEQFASVVWVCKQKRLQTTHP